MTNDKPFGRIAVVIDENGYVEDVRTDDPRLEDVTGSGLLSRY